MSLIIYVYSVLLLSQPPVLYKGLSESQRKTHSNTGSESLYLHNFRFLCPHSSSRYDFKMPISHSLAIKNIWLLLENTNPLPWDTFSAHIVNHPRNETDINKMLFLSMDLFLFSKDITKRLIEKSKRIKKWELWIRMQTKMINK